MLLSEGTRLGPYQVLAPLGAGGMGEVYRATDTRLKRQVAIKILPSGVATDPDRLARFQREAEVLASLNHPHIAAVYGLEETGGMRALVMELVEGSTLADRIALGPIPIDEALPIARQIAEALEAAHEQGIIHRDLKPANVKVRDDGMVKVLDFGLAKLADTGSGGRAGSDDLSQSPTLASPALMTGMGVILGTATYMSPEQARGKLVDKRSDIWAFGAVLYEMLTGKRPFEGDDITEMISSVLKTTPNWDAFPADVPPQIVTLVQRCLEKDRKSRIGDIAVAKFLLDGNASDSAVSAPGASRAAPNRSQLPPWLLAAALAVAALGTSFAWLRASRSATIGPVTHLQMSVAPADQLVGSSAIRPARTAITVSPDGRSIVFAGSRGNWFAQGASTAQLYLRALDRSEATPIAGTEGAQMPFFSPDGSWIGFWADNKIKKVSSAGGPPSVICEVPPGGGYGASWADDGTIFYANRFGIFNVSSAGGTLTVVTKPDTAKGERLLLPHPLPGGKSLTFTSMNFADWDTASVVVQSLDGGSRRVLIQGGADARYVGSGYLVFLKDGVLMAVPFDPRMQAVAGAPVALIDGVMQAENFGNGGDETGAGQFTVSGSGTLAYAVGGITPPIESSWIWIDRTGRDQSQAALPAGPYVEGRLSHDGQKFVVAVRAKTSRKTDVWEYDLVRSTPTRLTFDGGGFPVWSPDSKYVVFNGGNLTQISAGGGGKPERLTTGTQSLASGNVTQTPGSWSSAANAISFIQGTDSGTTGIWVLPMEGERKPRLFLESRFSLSHAEFSPDGHWMAYVSAESGKPEVYVQSYPDPGERTQVSTAGGFEPIWSSNGRELFYRNNNNTTVTQQYFTAPIRSLSPFRVDAPRLLFEAQFGHTYISTGPMRSWDVSPDGTRFLVGRPKESTDKPVTMMQVVLNWGEELKRLVPSK